MILCLDFANIACHRRLRAVKSTLSVYLYRKICGSEITGVVNVVLVPYEEVAIATGHLDLELAKFRKECI